MHKMEEKFNEIFLNFAKGKRQIIIPPKIKYDQMVATLQKLTSENPKSMSEKETYLLRNYFIRIEQQKAVMVDNPGATLQNFKNYLKICPRGFLGSLNTNLTPVFKNFQP